MNPRVLAFLGAAVVAALLALASTYNEFKNISDLLISIIGTLGSVLAIFEFINARR